MLFSTRKNQPEAQTRYIKLSRYPSRQARIIIIDRKDLNNKFVHAQH